jgi:hypothetical protein
MKPIKNSAKAEDDQHMLKEVSVFKKELKSANGKPIEQPSPTNSQKRKK